MINSGVIGLGIGEEHAFAYQRHSGSRLKSLCDFDRKKIKEMKTKFPEANIFHNNQSILKDDEIDIVSIASYDNYHSVQILQAFESGKHVMAEKPLCLNQDEMLQIYHVLPDIDLQYLDIHSFPEHEFVQWEHQ